MTTVYDLLDSEGLLHRQDATLIAMPSSTKNKVTTKSDPRDAFEQGGNPWYFVLIAKGELQRSHGCTC